MVKIQPKTLGEAYKGTISTFIVTLCILGVGFFLPMITAKEIQDAREGKGRYTPTEEIIWDFNGLDDLESVQYTSGGDELGITRSICSNEQYLKDNPTKIVWQYQFYRSHPAYPYLNIRHDITRLTTILDNDFEGTVGKYGMYTFNPIAKDSSNNVYVSTTPHPPTHKQEEVRIYFDIDTDTFIKGDATKLVIFIDFDDSEVDDSTSRIYIEYRNQNRFVSLTDPPYLVLTPNEPIIVDLTMEELIKIASMKSEKEYLYVKITTSSSDDTFKDNTPIIFDLQLYGVMGKPNAITILSIWYVVQSILIFMLGIVMLPQISFGGLSRLIGLNKEW